jgi:hypothetical protein
MRAYTKTRAYMVATPVLEIAKAEKSFFRQSSLMFWRSVSQVINNWAAGLPMWRSHGRRSK